MKVFGIGLSRTGTKSLNEALRILDFDVVHYPCDRRTYGELSRGVYRLSLLERRDGITDITVAPFYAQLDRIYPGSKFVLTLRDTVSWLASMEKHMAANRLSAVLPDLMTERKMRRLLRTAVYGSQTFSRDRYAHVFDLHRRNVIDHFDGRPESLLVMNLTAGEGWETLCDFLDRPVPDRPFPWIR